MFYLLKCQLEPGLHTYHSLFIHFYVPLKMYRSPFLFMCLTWSKESATDVWWVKPDLFHSVLKLKGTVLDCFSKRCLICAHFSPDSDEMTCSVVGRGHLFEPEAKYLNDEFVYYKWYAVFRFTKLLWCFYQLFRLSLTEPIDFRWSIGEHVMECYMFSKPVSTSSTSWMAWGWVHFQLIFIFGWAIPWMLICKWIVHLCS